MWYIRDNEKRAFAGEPFDTREEAEAHLAELIAQEPEAEGILVVVSHGLPRYAYWITVTRQDGSRDKFYKELDRDLAEGVVLEQERVTVKKIVEKSEPDAGKIGSASAVPTTSRPAY